jgi:hypothetical protein
VAVIVPTTTFAGVVGVVDADVVGVVDAALVDEPPPPEQAPVATTTAKTTTTGRRTPMTPQSIVPHSRRQIRTAHRSFDLAPAIG